MIYVSKQQTIAYGGWQNWHVNPQSVKTATKEKKLGVTFRKIVNNDIHEELYFLTILHALYKVWIESVLSDAEW